MGRRARKKKQDQPALQLAVDEAPTPWWPAVALVLLTILAYLPVMRAGFIWDDDYYVSHNLALRSAEGLARIWFVASTEPQYYPLTHTSFWIEHSLWGNSPLGYHVTNVLLHAASAVILWRLLLRLKVPAALFVAAFFAVHPAGVESVAWITERKNVLSGFFYLLAATMYWKAIGEPDERRELGFDAGPYAMAVVFFLCALLSKTVASTLPAAMVLILWWKRGRLRLKDLLPAIPLLLLGACLGWNTASMERTTVGAVGPEWNLAVADRILIAGRAVWFYVGKLLWPVDLTFIYTRWDVNRTAAWQWLYPASALAVVATLFALRNKIGRGPLTAVLFFVGTLTPALGFFNIFPMLYSFVADHFQYLASIGIFALVCGTMASAKWLPRRVAVSVGLAGVLVCAVLTFRQAGIYYDLKTLWTDTLDKNPHAWMASSNLAKIYLEEAESSPPDQREDLASKAQVLLERSIADKANNPTAIVHLGSTLSLLGDETGAVAQWDKVMGMEDQANPRAWPIAASDAQYQLGRHYMKLNDREKAAEHFSRALELQSGNVPAMTQFATLLASAGEYDQANGLFQQAAERSPDSPYVWLNIGNFQFQAGHPRDAIAAYDHAIALQPSYFQARYGRAIALAADGQLAAAETDLKALASENPNSSVLASLGTVLLKSGRANEARIAFQGALRIDPANPQARQQLDRLNAPQP